MPRAFHEPIEPEDIFDRAEATERRARIDAAKERNAAVAAQEAAQEAERRKNSLAFSMATNDRARAAEYRAHGVAPPLVNGVPTRSSLALLFSLGWTIEEVFGEKTLIAPPPADAQPRKRREDYDQNS